MKRAAQFALLVCVSILIASAQEQSGANLLNLSGTYTSTEKPKKGSPPEKIILSQTADALEITRFSKEGKPITNQLRLDGSVGDYTSAGGFHGKARLARKGRDLVVEVVENAVVDGRAIPIHMTERWQFSESGAVLITKTDVDCPQDRQAEPHTLNGSLYSCSMVFRGYPITEKYRKEVQP